MQLRLVEAFTGQIRGWLEAGKVDLGVLHDLGPTAGLSAHRLATEELYLVGPPGRFDKRKTPPSVGVSELDGLPMILPGPSHGLRQLIEQELTRLGLSVTVSLQIDAMAQIGSLIARGHGYSIMPLPAIAEDVTAGRVSIARIADGAIKRTLCLVRNSSQVVTHASIRCEDLLAKVLASLIGKGIWIAESHSK
jgi:LysR family nitrogen assimilation transcriptional regulator